jgi:L-threonylcarbamoyladenylate synthase
LAKQEKMSIRIRQAAQVLHAGGVLAYPTEGVWGLGCDPWDIDAVCRLLALKNRSWRKGLIVVAAGADQLQALLEPLERQQLRLLEESWPGPVTWLIPNNQVFPPWVTGDSSQVAVRVSAHPTVKALCREFGGPLVSTSANLQGMPPATTPLKVRGYFGKQLDYIVPGAVTRPGFASEIRDMRSGQVLRSG